MPRRRTCHQPALANSTGNTETGHCAEIDSASSANDRSSCTKRRSGSQLSNAKSQRCSDNNGFAIHSPSQDGEKSRTWTKCFKQSVACSSKGPGSIGDIASPAQQQFFDSTPNAAHGKRLVATFFDQPCVELARNLLGKYVVRICPEDGKRLSGRIVETEGYVGTEDRASHSYGGRRTARNEAMYMPPGTSYVYNIYGIYTCINISGRGDSYH